MNNNFIAGLFTGEGYFYKQLINNKYYFSLGIHLNTRDLKMLEDIKQYLGYGNITTRKQKKRKDGSDIISSTWRVGKRKELDLFIKDIAPLLMGYKKMCFEAWYEDFKK